MNERSLYCWCGENGNGKKKGRLSNLHPVDMGAIVIDELIDQTGVPTNGVDDVIFGVVSQIGSQAGNLGRNVAMSSKLIWRSQERLWIASVARLCKLFSSVHRL